MDKTRGFRIELGNLHDAVDDNVNHAIPRLSYDVAREITISEWTRMIEDIVLKETIHIVYNAEGVGNAHRGYV